jgi:hypothetical protein
MANSAYNYREFGYAFTQEDGIEYLHHIDGGKWRVARNLEDLVPGVAAFCAGGCKNEILEDVFKATGLVKLVIAYHKESSLPAEIGNLTNLKDLDLCRCDHLTTLPAGIGNLTNLAALRLNGGSSLTALPAEIGNLTNLATLKLRWCDQLTALPAEIGNLANLTSLSFYRCDELASLPAEIGKLTNLKDLDLRDLSIEIPLEAVPQFMENGVIIFFTYAASILNLKTICWIEPEFEQLMSWRSYSDHKGRVIN